MVNQSILERLEQQQKTGKLGEAFKASDDPKVEDTNAHLMNPFGPYSPLCSIEQQALLKAKEDRGDKGLEETRKNLMFSVDKIELYFFNYLVQKEPGVLSNEEKGFYDQTSTIFRSLKNRLIGYSLGVGTLFFLQSLVVLKSKTRLFIPLSILNGGVGGVFGLGTGYLTY